MQAPSYVGSIFLNTLTSLLNTCLADVRLLCDDSHAGVSVSVKLTLEFYDVGGVFA